MTTALIVAACVLAWIVGTVLTLGCAWELNGQLTVGDLVLAITAGPLCLVLLVLAAMAAPFEGIVVLGRRKPK